MEADENTGKTRVNAKHETVRDESTRVDLGEDLLDLTKTLPGLTSEESRRKSASTAVFDIEENFRSAEILFNEKLLEESKALLRAILTRKPDEVRAQKLLERIHEQELQSIFREEPQPRLRKSPKGTKLRDDIDGVEVDRVIAALERDLGRFKEDEYSMLFALETKAPFEADRERDVSSTSPKDRIDVGIAYLEMGLAETALYHFRRARELAVNHPNTETRDRVSATLLVATTLILSARARDAFQWLDPLVVDPEFPEDSKNELHYLLGRACEAAGESMTAIAWYAKVLQSDPGYRDTIERNRRLKAGKG